MVGLTYDYNKDAVKTRSNMGSYMFLNDGSLYQTDITTFFADAMFKYKGFAFMGEYAMRDADAAVAIKYRWHRNWRYCKGWKRHEHATKLFIKKQCRDNRKIHYLRV